MNNIWTQAIGNLGHAPELQYTDGGKLFAKANIAIEIGWGDKKDTLWASLVVWGENQAQRFHDYCQKGTRLYIAGTPTVNAYKSKEGEAKVGFNITVQEFRVLSGGKPKGEEQETPFDGE